MRLPLLVQYGLGYLLKESIDILVFMYRVSYQEKVVCETNTFGLMRPDMSLVQSGYRIL